MPDQNALEATGGVREQATDETRIWSIDVANLTASLTSPAVLRLVDEADPNTDLKSTKFAAGTPAVAGSMITLPALSGLAVGTMYRCYVQFEHSGNTSVVFFRIWCPVHHSSAALVTVPMLLEHLETDLPGSALQRLIDDAEGDLVRYHGEHPADGDITVLLPGTERLLFLPRPAASVTSVTETVNDSDTVLASDDYRLWYGNRLIQRRSGGTNSRSVWGDRVSVVYAPWSDDAQRRMAVIDLVRLALAQSGLQSERVGQFSYTSQDYKRERRRILGRLTPAYGGAAIL